jgi:hypothetical protein
MSLLAVQSVLARLYTDSAFRARFFDVPQEACPETGLTEAERRQLAELDRGQVERFARSLQRKRLGLVRELLPGTARVLPDRFGELFFQYCDLQPSALNRVEEAKAFAAYLSDAARRGDLGPTRPDYFSDLLTCERLRLEALYASEHNAGQSFPPPAARLVSSAENQAGVRLQRTPHLQVSSFRYDMEVLYPELLCGKAEEAKPDPCFILIGKVRGAMRVRLKRINDATARLLMRCDGTRRLGTIVDEVAAALRLNDAGRRELAAECARFLAPLVESDLIRVR